MGMASLKSFEEFEAWQNAREITRRVYLLTRQKPFAIDFGLKGEIRDAAVSIMSNIAEGFESQTENVFIRHLGIAEGSAGEVRSQLYVALDQNYISQSEFFDLTELCKKTARQIYVLMEYLQRSHL